MKTLIIILSILLTGCEYRANAWEVEAATKFCGSLEKIDHITLTATDDDSVTCRNGTRTYLRIY